MRFLSASILSQHVVLIFNDAGDDSKIFKGFLAPQLRHAPGLLPFLGSPWSLLDPSQAANKSAGPVERWDSDGKIIRWWNLSAETCNETKLYIFCIDVCADWAWTLGFTCLTDSLQATGYETSFIWVVEMFLNENRVPQKFYGVSSLSNGGSSHIFSCHEDVALKDVLTTS